MTANRTPESRVVMMCGPGGAGKVVAEVAANLKARLLRQVAAGKDVVLDFGFWFRRQRDEYRALLAPHGIVPDTVYIATSLETILSRICDRHGRRADDWPLTEQTATEYFQRFEAPTPEEGPLQVVR
ncbi:AAA family ATPase [Microbacterium sp. I2]|uniref:AAA family ATPase n=1 Tax=Microbacterium sp. I2 TaxID=3391826 RepID=UPI003EDA148B